MKIGIDASRGRSGGARAHLVGFLQEAEPENFGIEEIHVWCYSDLAKRLPRKKWLHIHGHPLIEKSLFHQVFWQYFQLKKELKKYKCDGLLSIDAGTVYVHKPSVVMSRDMLSFERSEISRYKGLRNFKSWLRLYILRKIQITSLKRATGALFLTKYASEVIQSWSGKIDNYRIIPHGVSIKFKEAKKINNWPKNQERDIQCLYVSNTAMYKHQWRVVEAISILRNECIKVKIEFIGGGTGKARKMLLDSINKYDKENLFVKFNEFVDHDKLPAELVKADIFIFASSCENMPNTLLEAMSCGLPIACSDRGPMPEVLKDAGIYFNPEEPISIANAVKKLIFDDNLREELANKARKYSDEYSWKRCSNETLEFLVETFTNFKKNK